LVPPKLSLLQPDANSGSRGLRQLELHRPLRFPLDHHGSREYPVPERDVAYSKTDEIAAAKLAIDSQVEHREIADGIRILKVDSDRPNIFRLERWFLADELALVPSVAFLQGFHTGSLVVDRSLILPSAIGAAAIGQDAR
jgi:hypothetical protein